MIIIRDTLAEDLDIVAANARPQDVAEMWASDRSTVRGALWTGFRRSRECKTVTVDGYPVIVFGVVPSDDDAGVIWAVLTHWVEDNPAAFLRGCRPVVESLRARYARLLNVADARNGAVLRWLCWLGFDVHEPAPFGPDRVPFCYFEMQRSCATPPH